MNTNNKIKELRIAHGMTQEELALKVGYSSRAMISQIESGIIDIPLSKIHLFSEVLHTSPQFLVADDKSENMKLLIEIETVCDKLNDSSLRRLMEYAQLLMLDAKNRKDNEDGKA